VIVSPNKTYLIGKHAMRPNSAIAFDRACLSNVHLIFNNKAAGCIQDGSKSKVYVPSRA